MMGRLEQDQGQLFYSFCLEEVVPDDHQVRAIASVLDLSWVYGELSPHYPALGRPSIDPVLMIRMLILGYAFGLRSERLLCREVRVNLAYRWFCGLSIEDKIPDHSVFSRARNDRFRDSELEKRTQVGHHAMSVRCHERTSANDSAACFDGGALSTISRSSLCATLSP